MENGEKKIVIGLIGEKCGGKGVTGDYIVSKYSAVKFVMSGVLDDILNRLHLLTIRENHIKLGISLRQNFSNDILAAALKGDMEKSDARIVIIDGIRHPEEVKLLKTISGFYLIYITAPIELRYERNQVRTNKVGESEQSFETFQNVERKATEAYIREIAQNEAHFTIINDKDWAELYKEIDNLMEKIVHNLNETLF